MIKQLYGPGVGLNSLLTQYRGKELVLAIAEATDGLGFRAVARITIGQLNAPRPEEGPDALVTRLAIDVVEVVAVQVCLVDAPLDQEVAEELTPGTHVHLGSRSQHAVQVEQRRVVIAPVHTRRLGRCSAQCGSMRQKSVRLPQTWAGGVAVGHMVRSW